MQTPKSKTEIFHVICRVVERDCPDDFAKAYARAGLQLHDEETCRVQALYLLSNMGGWKGEVANLCRECLKYLGKVPQEKRK